MRLKLDPRTPGVIFHFLLPIRSVDFHDFNTTRCRNLRSPSVDRATNLFF